MFHDKGVTAIGDEKNRMKIFDLNWKIISTLLLELGTSNFKNHAPLNFGNLKSNAFGDEIVARWCHFSNKIQVVTPNGTFWWWNRNFVAKWHFPCEKVWFGDKFWILSLKVHVFLCTYLTPYLFCIKIQRHDDVCYDIYICILAWVQTS